MRPPHYSRDTLVAAANAYLDAFLEGKIDRVPWGFPCVRVEGGAYLGYGSPADGCEVGVPSGVNIVNRHFVVDEVIGSVVAFCTFGAGGPNGGSGSPDTHLFRVQNGKLRYVHTLTGDVACPSTRAPVRNPSRKTHVRDLAPLWCALPRKRQLRAARS